MKKEITIGQSILEMPSRPDHHVAVKFKDSNQWVEKTWSQYYTDIETTAAGFLNLGVKAGDRVAIMANTRYEWAVTDLALFGIKAITVAIYQNNMAEDVEYILNDSKARFLLCESKVPLKAFESVKAQCPTVEKVIVLDKQDKATNYLSWEQLQSDGKKYLSQHPNTYRETCATLKITDMATLLYTSGTTGKPKGVVLTHLQVISEVSEAFPLCGANPTDTSLTFLPYAHILGRIEHWGHTYIGFTMAFAEGMEKMRTNLTDIRPTLLVAVPRIFEKIYAGIFTQVQSNPLKNKLFNWALRVGRDVGDHKFSGQTLPLKLLVEYELAQRLVLDQIKQAFGGRLRFAISGGAPISRDIALFFNSAGILVLEGYGLTETTGAITVNTPFNYRFGSVGRPIGEAQVRIADDGEVMIKSDKVMKEYYQNPAATAEAFTDGWFHTGDIGELLPGGDLKITDRKKDLIKTAGGKYVAPQRLENFVKLSPAIAQVVIYGDQKKYIVALLTLDKDYVKKFAEGKSIKSDNWDELVREPAVQELARQAVAEANSQLASYETIKRYLVVPAEFTVESGELTPSLKIKRKVLDAKYKEQLESLYN